MLQNILSKLRTHQKMTFDGLKFYYHSQHIDYMAHGVSCPDEFQKYGFEYDRDIGNSRSIYKNKAGEKALVIHVSVPTFDSGDREWDSYRKLFLIPKENEIECYMVCGGYHVAQVVGYKGIYCTDKEIKELLNGIKKEL